MVAGVCDIAEFTSDFRKQVQTLQRLPRYEAARCKRKWRWAAVLSAPTMKAKRTESCGHMSGNVDT